MKFETVSQDEFDNAQKSRGKYWALIGEAFRAVENGGCFRLGPFEDQLAVTKAQRACGAYKMQHHLDGKLVTKTVLLEDGRYLYCNYSSNLPF